MKLTYILIPVIVLFVSGCGSLKSKVKTVDVIEKKLEQKQVVLDKHARIYLDGAITAIKSKPKLEETDKFILRLLDNTQSIIGNPLATDRIGVDAVLSKEAVESKKLLVLEENTNKLITEKGKLEEEKKKADIELKEKAEHIVATQKSWLEKTKDKFTGALVFMLIGAAILMFGPQLLKVIKLFIKPL